MITTNLRSKISAKPFTKAKVVARNASAIFTYDLTHIDTFLISAMSKIIFGFNQRGNIIKYEAEITDRHISGGADAAKFSIKTDAAGNPIYIDLDLSSVDTRRFNPTALGELVQIEVLTTYGIDADPQVLIEALPGFHVASTFLQLED